MDKKKLLALAIFLIMGFFMVTFANPSDQLTPVDNNANEPVANNTNANQPTPTDNAQTRPTTPAANAGTTTNTPIVTPVVDDNTDTQPTNDDENNDPQVNVYTVTFVDHEGKALKIQAVAEHQDATDTDITVLDYTVANMTYTFAKWDKDFTDVTTNLTVKALYSVKSIIAVVTIDGEKTDKTVEVYVNEDTENKKDVKLTDDNINEYINVDQLPEVNPGENNTVKELTYDEEDGYTIEIETELIDYTVTGTKTDEGTVTVNGKDEIIANIGDEVVLANESKYGYDFVNYVVTEGNETTTLEATYDEEGNETTTITVGTSDITVSANYVRHEFDVVFKAHNFTSETQKVAYEGSATEPTLEEANKNYEEAGYAYSFADQWDVDFSKITADTVVNAIYTREAIDYDITYKYVIEGTTNEGFFAEGENTNRTSYTTEDSFRLVAPKKQGYDFVKWTENNNDVTGINAGEYGNRTFVAVFTPSKNTKYRVISYAQKLEVNPNAENAIDNYTIVKNVKYNYEGKATTASTVEVTPAAMTGFVTPAAKEETIAADGSTVYTFFYDRQEHTLTFKLNGNVMKGYPQTLKYETPITAPELSAEEGYTLNGFGTVAKTMGEKDLTYEATITPNTNTKYTVVVNEENTDGTTKTTRTTKTGTTGTTVTETQSAKEGFNLDATSKEVTITGDGKAEVVFNYTRIKSTLTFTIKDTDTNVVETIKTVENVPYGATIETYKPDYTVAEGYNFVDWNVTGNMPAEAKTIEATKNIKKFTVKWEIDGKVVETDENVRYNTKAIYNGQTPTKDGYTYLGWKDANGNDENVAIKANTTFKAQLVTLTAKIKANHQLSYTKSYNGNKPELVKEDITVTVENLGGADKVLAKNEYTTDFNNTEFVKSKTLNITYTSGNLTLTNNKLKYSVIYLAYNSKFEVDVSIKNTFTYTIDDKCKGTDGQRCDRGDKVDEYTLDHNFLEVTEHYNQFVQVQSATVKYTDGSTKTLNLSDRVRWSYVENVIDEDNIYTISANESTITSGDDYPQNAYEKRKYSNYNEYYYVKKIGKCTSNVCKYYVATKAKGTYYSDVRYYAFDRDGDLALHKPKTKEGYHDPVYIATKNNGYSDVMDKSHVIDTVTVRYHRNENVEDNETEGYFDVVFKYDPEVEGGFYCIDEKEVK